MNPLSPASRPTRHKPTRYRTSTAIASAALAIAVAAAVSLAGCSRIAARVANQVYPALDQPWDVENAPTATSFPSASNIRAVIGGRGKGLGCSIPQLAEALMFSRTGDEAPVTLALRQACVFHDYCYRHGHATYGYTKLQCDIRLQEHAYRLCRQISGTDPGQEACRSRARVVLLGVNFFGGDNFAHAHESTYFEFDPVPQGANDYVAARLIRHAPHDTENIDPKSRNRDLSLWTFYFKEGWMQIADRRHRHPPGTPLYAVPFLREKIHVPPRVIAAGDTDRLVWFARRTITNTGVFAFSAEAVSARRVEDILNTRMAYPGSERTKCRPKYKDNVATPGYAALEFDCDTTMTRAAALDCGARPPRALVVTLGHRREGESSRPFATERNGSITCGESDYAFALSANHIPGHSVEHDAYRFAQDDFLLGHFRSSTALGLIALGRGVQPGQTSSLRGDGYRRETAVLQQTIADPANETLTPLALKEEQEPLAPYRAAGEPLDRVISVRPACSDAHGCELVVEDWMPSDGWRHTSGRVAGTSPEWLRQPAQILEPAVAGEGDWLVLSRVQSSNGAAEMKDPAFRPSRVRLEYRAFRRQSDGWHEDARACRAVSLREQIASDLTEYLVKRYFSDASRAHACVSGGALTEVEANSCTAMWRDFASRWHRSQVLPGYIYNSVNSSSAAGSARKPDAMFVFNGFTRYSVTLRSDSHVDQDWTSECDGEAGKYASPGNH